MVPSVHIFCQEMLDELLVHDGLVELLYLDVLVQVELLGASLRRDSGNGYLCLFEISNFSMRSIVFEDWDSYVDVFGTLFLERPGLLPFVNFDLFQGILGLVGAPCFELLALKKLLSPRLILDREVVNLQIQSALCHLQMRICLLLQLLQPLLNYLGVL